jgi:chemotaxis receptor (MCP) glutamine deamidase CheD
VLVELLKKLKLKISAEDVGGRTNRSIQLNISTGYVRLKFSGQPQPKTLCKP